MCPISNARFRILCLCAILFVYVLFSFWIFLSDPSDGFSNQFICFMFWTTITFPQMCFHWKYRWGWYWKKIININSTWFFNSCTRANRRMQSKAGLGRRLCRLFLTDWYQLELCQLSAKSSWQRHSSRASSHELWWERAGSTRLLSSMGLDKMHADSS